MPLKEALTIINSEGFDFTEDELKDYVNYIISKDLNTSDEVHEKTLFGINGGNTVDSQNIIFELIRMDTSFKWIKLNERKTAYGK